MIVKTKLTYALAVCVIVTCGFTSTAVARYQVIFDLDDTLITSPSLPPCWQQACTENGLDLETVKRVTAANLGESAWKMLELMGVNDPAVQDRIVNRFWELVGEGDARPLPGAQDAVRFLAERADLFLATGSTPALAQRNLTKFNLIDSFKLVIGSTRNMQKGRDQYQRIAEHIEGGWAALRASGIAVGDGLRDVGYGRQYDLPVRIGVTTTHTAEELRAAGANIIVGSPGEIIAKWDSIQKILRDHAEAESKFRTRSGTKRSASLAFS